MTSLWRPPLLRFARAFAAFANGYRGAAGEIDLRPWRRYSDGSVNESVVDTFTVKVPAYGTKKTFAKFGYNPQEHELLGCGVYSDDNVVPTKISVVRF